MPKKSQKPQKMQSKQPEKQSAKAQTFAALKKPFSYLKKRSEDFLSRRPHRSFRLTRRRDYARSLKLPGYFAFTGQVFKTIWSNRKSFLAIILIYCAISALLIGISPQETFSDLRDNLSEIGQGIAGGGFGSVTESAILASSMLFGSLTPELSEAQQVYLAIMGLLTWLAVVWMLRQRLAGRTATLRDALYNSGAPVIPTGIISIIFILQLVPIAVVSIGYAAASSTGLIDGGVEAMMFWLAAAGLTCLSVYWVTATALALVIITLPGMYPLRALKIAGDMVVGRRIRILLRLFWLVLLMVAMWFILMTIAVLIDAGIKALLPVLSSVPVVPIAALILGALSLLLSAVYVYLLYRRIVDDDAKPA